MSESGVDAAWRARRAARSRARIEQRAGAPHARSARSSRAMCSRERARTVRSTAGAGRTCAGRLGARAERRAREPQGPRINMVTAIRRTLDARARGQSAHAGVRRGRGPQGRRARGDARACRRSSAWRACSTPACPRKASSAAPSAWRWRGCMPVRRDPVPQVRRSRRRAAQRLRHDALAHRATDSPRPMVVRIPGGFFKCGDPWHSQTNEVPGCTASAGRWPCPRNAQDAVGLLRAALRGNDPVIFFEHRAHARWRLGAPSLSGR